jgi:hypothetical protein
VSESKGIHWGWLIVAVALLGGLMLWGYMDQHHYFYHDKLARITSAGWNGRNAKDCDEWNLKTDLPVLECDGGHSDLQETIRVRFYGDTRLDLQPDELRLHWKCTRNSDSSPAVTCRFGSVE